jgi:LPS-assembly protein
VVPGYRYSGTRDLDIVRDHPQYTDRKILTSDLGLNTHLNLRRNLFTATAEMNYLRNQLYADPLTFDRSYVQTLPRVTLASTPYSLVQSRVPGLQHIAVGFDGTYSRFRQVDNQDDVFLRNADRLSIQPYLMWHFFTWGPVSLKSRYTLDHQSYQFLNTQPGAGKTAGMMQTEVSFTMDKIFGLAYEEKIPVKYISEADIQRLREKKEKGLTPIQKSEKESTIIGNLEPFESDLAAENIVQVRKSYRHSQDFKMIHHYMPSQNTYGNKQFINQIRTQAGWFDYEDAIRSKEYLIGGTTTRTIIPPENTAELQWNNTLIRKTPKTFSYLDDDKFLRDNFAYNRIGYFNVSQGYLLNNVADSDDYRARLTRLWLSAGYYADRWSVSANEYYFHLDKRSIYSLNVTRRFDSLNVFANYNYNGFTASKLNTLSVGGQVRPTDVIGFALVKDVDLEAKKDIRTIYSIDIMPHNNCWILNLNKRESLVGSRYSFNIIFNFGDDKFDKYRNDYFAVKRM